MTLTVVHRGLIAEFIVADTGIGIAAGDLENIFEPFNRGSAVLAQGQPGAGLGLAITRMLAQVMGGDVSVSSTIGTGSVFKLRLMLPATTQVGAATHLPGIITGYIGERRTVLAVDDDAVQLHALRSLLHPLGFTVWTALNGKDGLALAAQHAPDLVLLDIQLGDHTGWDIARRLRDLPDTTAPKILMVSANAHEFESGRVKAGLAHDGFVSKPVRFDSLLDLIGVQLGLRWERAPVALATQTTSTKAPSAMPPELIDCLRNLAQMGDRRSLENKLAETAALRPEATMWFDQLRTHLHNFDLNAFLCVLDRHG